MLLNSMPKAAFVQTKEARTVGGATALMYAVQSGNIQIVGECLNRGFNPYAKDDLDQTPDIYAKPFEDVNGQNIAHLIIQAQQQWLLQLTREEIELRTNATANQNVSPLFQEFINDVHGQEQDQDAHMEEERKE